MKALFKFIMVITLLGVLSYVLIDKYDIDVYLSQMGQEDTTINPSTYIEQVRTAMLEGETELKLHFKGKEAQVNEFTKDAIEQAFAIDKEGTSSDFDYLKMKYSGMKVLIQGMGNVFTISYQFDYIESKEQTEQVDIVIDSVLADLKIEERTDFEKIKMIHDFIIKNASYDLETEKNTAYDNLINKKSVCQGYAALVYKMMTQAKIPCRVITGQGKGVSHAWNIVKLEDKWYNIDCTWDDPVSESREEFLEYDYFLKSEGDFRDHIRGPQYTTQEFNDKYTIAKKSFEQK